MKSKTASVVPSAPTLAGADKDDLTRFDDNGITFS
jgi:hypothetical protein